MVAAIVNFKDWALLYHQDHQCCPNSFLPLVTLVQYAVVYDKQTKRLLEKTSQKNDGGGGLRRGPPKLILTLFDTEIREAVKNYLADFCR